MALAVSVLKKCKKTVATARAETEAKAIVKTQPQNHCNVNSVFGAISEISLDSWLLVSTNDILCLCENNIVLLFILRKLFISSAGFG